MTITGNAHADEPLQGRIEKIFGPNGSVFKLEELDAKAEEADPNKLKRGPNRVAADLKTFPATLRGEWKGNVQSVQNDCTPEFWHALPSEASFDQSFFDPIRKGLAQFRFYLGRDQRITMDEPELTFAVASSEAQSLNKRPGTRIFLETRHDPKNSASNSGECTYYGRILRNSVKRLSSTVTEQDTLVESTITNRKTAQRTTYYVEDVFRFDKKRPFEMYVQVVEALYGLDGKLWRRTLFDGDLH